MDGGINLYAYVGGDPVNWVDPKALKIQIIGDPAQQQYILKQLEKFVRGCLSIDSKGFLIRKPCGQEDECIESDIDQLIDSPNLYRIYSNVESCPTGRACTQPTWPDGGDVYFDPNVDANYNGGLWPHSITPAAELAHEVLGRLTQLENDVPHGNPGSPTRRESNERAVDLANRAFDRMGLPRRTSYP